MPYSEAVVRRCSIKKVFLEVSQNSQENTCVRDSFLIKLQTWPATLLKKGLWHKCFPVNFARFLSTPFLQNSPGGCFCKLQVNKRKFFHTYSVMHFAFVFSEYIIFSQYVTITSSKEALKVCEHNFFQEI